MRRLARFVGLLGLLALAGASLAQPAGTPGREPRLTLSPPEMIEQAEEKLAAMRSTLGDSFGELASARKTQDIQRLSCVNEALTAVKGLVRLAEQNYVSLREATAQGDTEAAEHEFVKLSLAAGKVGELSAQLKACAGPTVASEADGEPELKVLSDSELSDDQDPMAWYSDSEVVLEVPSSSSPFI